MRLTNSNSFTLIELMAASTVLSIVLLMMVGMQDQMSRAWSNANRRTDATREASAACRLMAQDLSCLVFRGLGTDAVNPKQFGGPGSSVSLFQQWCCHLLHHRQQSIGFSLFFRSHRPKAKRYQLGGSCHCGLLHRGERPDKPQRLHPH